MDGSLLNDIVTLAPDLFHDICLRAQLVECIAAFEPIGRRQLALKLNITERETRRIADILSKDGFIRFNHYGMTLTDKSKEVLSSVQAFNHMFGGLDELEARLCELLHVGKVYIVAGNTDTDSQVLSEVGRLAASKIRDLLQNGQTIAVSGGYTLLHVCRHLSSKVPMNIMVIPARGGVGQTVETQANTIAAEFAKKLGGFHRLMYLPDQMDQTAFNEVSRLPEIQETMELLKRVDIIIHGINQTDAYAKPSHKDKQLHKTLLDRNVVAESLGSFFDISGHIVYNMSSVGINLNSLRDDCQMVAVATGRMKAKAIISVLRFKRHSILVTDEGAASEIFRLLEEEQVG